MTVSIIVPIYNVEDYLADCLESLIHQTYRDIEIVLVNDGSTDNSLTICENYKKRDQRIKLYTKTNGGLSDARNYGLDRSQGELVTFVDSDDYLSIDSIACLVNALGETESDIAIASFYYDKDGRVHPSNQEGEFQEVFSSREVMERIDVSEKIPSVTYIISWAKLYRKHLFETIAFPAGKIHEDEFTTYKLYLEANRIVYINTPLYFYRQRSNSITQSRYTLSRLDGLEALEERELYLKERGYPIFQTQKKRLALLAYHAYQLKRYRYVTEFKRVNKEYHNLLNKLSRQLSRKEKINLWMRRYCYPLLDPRRELLQKR